VAEETWRRLVALEMVTGHCRGRENNTEVTGHFRR
jgi:hypothetical protein